MDRIYTTTTMLGALRALDRPTAWLRDTFFGETVTFDTAEIAFDKVARRRKLAPFVSPTVAGKARKSRGLETRTFTPAYVKPKHAVTPDQALIRMAGERIGGDLSAEERFNATVLQLLADQDNEITRREEWMCAQILQGGAVVVQGNEYPAQTVDFARDAALTITLAGGARWGQAGVAVFDSLTAWASLVAEKSGGAATDVILGSTATRLVQSDAEVRQMLQARGQLIGNTNLGPVALGSEDMVAAYLGSVGQFNLWSYAQKYVDENDAVLDMFPATGCLMVSGQAFAGAMCYGAIQDNRALRPMSRFPKMWEEEDPSVTNLMTQSAPLPVPRDVNGTLFATVA